MVNRSQSQVVLRIFFPRVVFLCLHHHTSRRCAATHNCIALQCLFHKNIHSSWYTPSSSFILTSLACISVLQISNAFKRALISKGSVQMLKLNFLRVILTHNFVFKGVFSGFSAWNTLKMCIIRSPDIKIPTYRTHSQLISSYCNAAKILLLLVLIDSWALWITHIQWLLLSITYVHITRCTIYKEFWLRKYHIIK